MPLALVVDMTGAYYYVFDRIGWGSNHPPPESFLLLLASVGVCSQLGRVLNCFLPSWCETRQ